MKVHSLPIYWGNPLVHLDFDTRSFLNHAEFESDEALIEKIIELDRDDDKLLAQLRQPCFHGNRLNRYVDPENILDQFETIFASNRRPVARSTRFYFLHRQRHRLMRNAARIVRQAARAIRKE
jgi:hypothetical protein